MINLCLYSQNEYKLPIYLENKENYILHYNNTDFIKINDSIKNNWLNTLSIEQKASLNYGKLLGSKKINIEWDLSYTDYNYIDNYVNGFEISITNNSKKVIKYVTFNVVGYNSVDDLVYDPYKTRKGIGPVYPNEIGSWIFDNCWIFNETVSIVKLKSVVVEYMDKSKLVINDIRPYLVDTELLDLYLNSEKELIKALDEGYSNLYLLDKAKFEDSINIVNKRIQDSINIVNKRIQDSLDLVKYNKEFRDLNKRINIMSNYINSLIALKNIDDKKKKFIIDKLGRDLNNDFKVLDKYLSDIKSINSKIDTNSIIELKIFISNNNIDYKQRVINNIIDFYEINGIYGQYFPRYEIHKNNSFSEYDFIVNKLKKTYAYKKYKDNKSN
jgi:hypothetical protein